MQLFPAVVLLVLKVDVGAGPLLVLNSMLVSIFSLTLLLIRDKLLALKSCINWQVAV